MTEEQKGGLTPVYIRGVLSEGGIPLFVHTYHFMIPVSKVQKAVCACTIRLLNLGHGQYEKVAIYVVNQRISNIERIAGAAKLRSNL